MNFFLNRLVPGALASLFPLTLLANSYVYNSTDQNVDVIWKAAGCAGIKKTVELGCQNSARAAIETVCQKKTLAPGEGEGYTFKWGTTNRDVQAFTCINNSNERANANTDNGGNKSRCAARIKSDGSFGVTCGYSKQEYTELKAQ